MRIPTITDPRGLDFATYKRLKQTEAMADIEARAIAAFEALGVLMTNTCINYQTILPPVRGEHLAMGDTGVVIYSNSVHGRAQQLRGRALGAGRRPDRPHAALRLPSRCASRRHQAFRSFAHQPRDLADWGALGGIVGKRHQQLLGGAGRHAASRRAPNSDELKHFGAALASFGSVALFHMPGVTPEARDAAPMPSRAVPSPPAVAHRQGRLRGVLCHLRGAAATRSTWWCSPRRSSR